MIRYAFRENEPVRIKAAGRADPQAIGEAIAKVAAKSGGRPDPEKVVEAAKSRNSALHPHFEWDDAKAAHSHRLDQARNLIRIIKTVDEDTGEVEPAYLSINNEDGRDYYPIDQVKRNADLQIALMKQAARDLTAWQNRYKMLKDLCPEIGAMRERIEAQIAKSETRAAA